VASENHTNASSTNEENNQPVSGGYLRLCHNDDKEDKNNRSYSYRAVESASISVEDPCDRTTGDEPSPLIRMTPGNTYKLVLINHIDEPTNLHTHGLHVSGVGTVDGITRSADCLVYEYLILDDADHVGTFWYHSHRHPVAAQQVSKGAYGMLLIEETY
jgi:FtsP/CotA-like multicopper oxidase with cupredoxin domain